MPPRLQDKSPGKVELDARPEGRALTASPSPEGEGLRHTALHPQAHRRDSTSPGATARAAPSSSGGRRPRPPPTGPVSLFTRLSGFKNPGPSPRAAASFGEGSRHLPAGEALNLPIQDEQQRAWTAPSQQPVRAARKVPLRPLSKPGFSSCQGTQIIHRYASWHFPHRVRAHLKALPLPYQLLCGVRAGVQGLKDAKYQPTPEMSALTQTTDPQCHQEVCSSEVNDNSAT